MRSIVLAFMLAVCATPALAQTASAQNAQRAPVGSGVPLVPGSRVRVRATNLVAPLVASYIEARGDTLMFFEEKAGRGIWSLTLDQITKIETTVGEQAFHSSSILKASAIGAGVGALGAGFFAANFHPSDKGEDYNVLKTGFIGGVIGGGLGALYGMRLKGEKWREVPLPRRTAFAPNLRGGWSLSASFAF